MGETFYKIVFYIKKNKNEIRALLQHMRIKALLFNDGDEKPDTKRVEFIISEYAWDSLYFFIGKYIRGLEQIEIKENNAE